SGPPPVRSLTAGRYGTAAPPALQRSDRAARAPPGRVAPDEVEVEVEVEVEAGAGAEIGVAVEARRMQRPTDVGSALRTGAQESVSGAAARRRPAPPAAARRSDGGSGLRSGRAPPRPRARQDRPEAPRRRSGARTRAPGAQALSIAVRAGRRSGDGSGLRCARARPGSAGRRRGSRRPPAGRSA